MWWIGFFLNWNRDQQWCLLKCQTFPPILNRFFTTIKRWTETASIWSFTKSPGLTMRYTEAYGETALRSTAWSGASSVQRMKALTIKIQSRTAVRYWTQCAEVKKYCPKPEPEIPPLFSEGLIPQFDKTKSNVTPKASAGNPIKCGSRKQDDSILFYPDCLVLRFWLTR